MKTLPATISLLMLLLVCGTSFAQTSTPNASLFTSSPAMGSSPPVGAVGIPLGATELAVPGIAPPPVTGSIGNGCSATGATTTSTGSTSFDGGGMAATSAIGCPQSGSGPGSSMPSLGLTAGQTGPAGIPLGSTELSNSGLSPLPPLTTINIPMTAPTMAPTSTGTSSVLSSAPSTSPCAAPSSFGGQILPGQNATTASGC